MNLFFLLILYPTVLLKYQSSVWALRKADATMELHMQEIYWEVPGREVGRSRSGQGEPSGQAAGVTAARPHSASVFLFQRSTELCVPVFYL